MNDLFNQTQNIEVGVITLKEITDLISVRHDKAMVKVESLAKEPSFGQLSKMDICIKVNNDGSKKISTYSLSKKQAIAVGAKLNNSLLMKVIDKLEELEKANAPQIPQTFSEALFLASKQAEVIEQQTVALEQKSETIRHVVHSDNTYTASQVAKDMENPISAALLNKMLNEAGVIFKQNDCWQLYSKYVGYKLTSIKETKPNENGKSFPSLRWTALGKSWIFKNWDEIKQRVKPSTLNEWQLKIGQNLPKVSTPKKKKDLKKKVKDSSNADMV